MDKSYRIVRNFQFKGIMSNCVDNIIPQGFVPDMQNLTVSMEGLAQNIKAPSELSLYWEAWEANHDHYHVGDVITLKTNTGYFKDYFFICTAVTTGISGATEPVWDSPIVDGGVTWTMGEKITDPIISFYHYHELTEIYAIQIGTYVVLFDGTNQATGYKFSDSSVVSFASGASNDNYLYIMHPTDGLRKYTFSVWFNLTKKSEADQSSARVDPITVGDIDYSGGTPPKSQKIFAYKNRLWAYGYLTEGIGSAGGVSRIHWSEIASLPEDHVAMTYELSTHNPPYEPKYPAGSEIIYTDTTKLRDSEHVLIDNNEYWANTLTYPWKGADYWDPYYFIDISSTGDDIITGVVPYEQALYIFTRENVYNLTFYTTYDVTCQQIASNIDGVILKPGYSVASNFIVVGKGIYYIGSKGLYSFATPTPVKISQPIQNLIDPLLPYAKGIAYFNDRVYFAFNPTSIRSEVWVFDITKGTWEKYVYNDFHIETILSSNHVYATTTTGDVYELDTEASTYLSWYMELPKMDLGNLYAEKRPEDIVVHFKIPTASSTMTILMTDNLDVDTNVATDEETFTIGLTGLLNEKHFPIYKGVIKSASFKLSGDGEIKLLGIDTLFKTYHRKRI